MSDLLMSDAVSATGAEVAVSAQSAVRGGPGLNLPLAGALFLHLAALILLASGGGGKRALPPRVYPIRLYRAAEVAAVITPTDRQPPLGLPTRALPLLTPAVAAVRLVVPPPPNSSAQKVLIPVSTPAVAAAVSPVIAAVVPEVADGVVPPGDIAEQSGSAGALLTVSGNAPVARTGSAPGPGSKVPVSAGVAGTADTAPVAPPLVMAQPLYRENPAPEYPPLARRRGLEGTVILEVQVGVDGRAKELLLHHSSDYPILDDAALRAVKGWRFEPGRRGAEPLAMQVLVPVRFSLH